MLTISSLLRHVLQHTFINTTFTKSLKSNYYGLCKLHWIILLLYYIICVYINSSYYDFLFLCVYAFNFLQLFTAYFQSLSYICFPLGLF